jgi:hypothetical protein
MLRFYRAREAGIKKVKRARFATPAQHAAHGGIVPVALS